MTSSIKISSLLLFLLVLAFPIYAQQELQRGTPIPVECGDIIDSEFRNNHEEQAFTINMNAGDSFEASIAPLGQLNTFMMVTGPTNLGITVSNARMGGDYVTVVTLEAQPKVTTGILGASGAYTIRIINTGFVHASAYIFSQDEYYTGYRSGGIGAYTLSIGCTLRNNTVIKPGDSLSAEQPDSGEDQPPIPTFSGIGFPGLPPVDFANALITSFDIGEPNDGRIPPTGDGIFGYTLDAAANDTLDLTFTRLSGNLNLGLVVLSADNQVMFQASLVTSTTLNTHFTLPSAGQYTIGVFRIDLLPPAAPEATAFQVQGTLNP